MAGELPAPDPEFLARLDRIKHEHRGVLNRLESHLGCVICRSPLDADGNCPNDDQHEDRPREETA